MAESTHQKDREAHRLISTLSIEQSESAAPVEQVAPVVPAEPTAEDATVTSPPPSPKKRGPSARQVAYQKKTRNAQKARKRAQKAGSTGDTTNAADNDDGQPESSTSAAARVMATASVAPKVDLDAIPVTISVRHGDIPFSVIMPSIPVINTTLGLANTHFKVVSAIQTDPNVIHPLMNIYNLTTADHKVIYLCFTESDGQRHFIPLFYWPDPFLNGDKLGLGAILLAWKNKVMSGKLDPVPKCACDTCKPHNDRNRRHGVEIWLFLKLNNVVSKCHFQYQRNRLVGDQSGLIATINEKAKLERDLAAAMEHIAKLNFALNSMDKDSEDEEEHEEGEDDVTVYVDEPEPEEEEEVEEESETTGGESDVSEYQP